MNEEYISGKNPVIEALKSERDINKIWIAEGSAARTNAANYQIAKEENVLSNLSKEKN